MALEVSKTLGLPLGEELADIKDLPHTITFAVTYRSRINSFYELPKDKQPPRDLWDKPHRLSEFFERVFKIKGSGNKSASYVEFSNEDVE